MGKNKGKDAAAAAASGKPTSRWKLGRRWKKLVRWTFWVILPLSVAFAVAYFAPPPPPEQSSTPSVQSSDAAPAATKESSTGERPPVDTHPNQSECQAWAGSGQCKENPGFMLVNCAWSCKQLDLVRERYARRCPLPSNDTAALAPGKMHAIFDRVMRDFPHLEPERISDDPPVILFHKFLSEAEADAFIRHGQGRYSKSCARWASNA